MSENVLYLSVELELKIISSTGCTVLTARAWTVGVKNDCKSMSVKLRYWIVKLI